jgi:hypothetical protein
MSTWNAFFRGFCDTEVGTLLLVKGKALQLVMLISKQTPRKFISTDKSIFMSMEAMLIVWLGQFIGNMNTLFTMSMCREGTVFWADVPASDK